MANPRTEKAAPKPEKVAAVEDLERRLKGSSVVILTDYRGLTVQEIGALRGRLREVNVDYRVAKNTLLALAAKRCGLDHLSPLLTGPTAVAFGRDDPGVPARVLQEFIRQYRKLEIKGGVLGQEALRPEEVRALATLPSRAELLARTLGVILSPLRALVTILNAPPRSLVQILEALRARQEAREASEGTKPPAAEIPAQGATSVDAPVQAADPAVVETVPAATPAEGAPGGTGETDKNGQGNAGGLG
jgi:large subunit ribosomal protein L10